jgi:hypothetical protein
MHPALLGLLLIVRIFDNAGLPAATANAAQRVAADIFRSAGIEVAWVFCIPPGHLELPKPPACTQTPAPPTLMIRILRQPRTPGTADALGDAHVDRAAGEGTLATIYLERITSVAHQAQIDVSTLAGWTMAHELGHLLLGTTAHSATGLMRAQWSTAILRHPAGNQWRFSPGEAALLAGNMVSRETRD